MIEIPAVLKQIRERLDSGYTTAGQKLQSEYPEAAQDLEKLLADVLRIYEIMTEGIYAMMSLMPEELRLDLMSRFCRHCGAADPKCVCWRDE